MLKKEKNNTPGIINNGFFYPSVNLQSGIIRIVLTTKCNFLCPHCFQEGENIDNHRTLDVDFILKIMEFGKKYYGVHTARLTGGEPLLYENIDKLLEGLNNIGIENVDFTTNGFFLEEKLPILKKNGIKLVTVSLNTLNNSNFDKLSGTKGNLQKVLNSIELAKKEGMKININLTAVNDLNKEEIYDVVEYGKKNNLIVRICEPTHIVGCKNTKNTSVFKETSQELILKSKEKIQSLCESVLYLTLNDDSKITIMYNLCDNRLCNSCSKYLYLRLTSEKKLKPCLSRTDTESIIGDDLSDENLHKAFCMAIANMGKGPDLKTGIVLIKKKMKW